MAIIIYVDNSVHLELTINCLKSHDSTPINAGSDISAVNYTFIVCSCETLLNYSHILMVLSTMEPSINGLFVFNQQFFTAYVKNGSVHTTRIEGRYYC